MKATLTNFRQPPRKVRLLARYIKGKQVKSALTELDFLGKKASLPLKKLIVSAVANTNLDDSAKDDLYIKNITVDKGLVMKRFMPRAQGRATMIRHRTSHIKVELEEKSPKETQVKSVETKEKPKTENKDKQVKKQSETKEKTTKKSAKATKKTND